MDFLTTDFCKFLTDVVSEFTRADVIEEIKYRRPWVTTEFRNLCKRRNNILKQRKKKPGNTFIHAEYDLVCNRINCIKKTLKAEYYNRVLTKATNNPRKRWAFLNKITHNSDYPPTCTVQKLTINNESLHDDSDIANA